MAEPDSSSEQPRGFEALKRHCIENKLNVALWVTRLLTIIFTTLYFIPIFGNPYNSYYKALVANGATSAIRLHQRLPTVTLSREFLATLLMEDSCHYLLYSLIFLYVSPVALALLPVFLFSLIHFASYSLTLLDTLGQNSWWGARICISLVEFQSRNILRLIAFSEIILQPLVVLLIFLGHAGLLTPFVYYHFLTLRYKSRRNPYTKNMFHELRIHIETLAANPSVPGFLKGALLQIVAFTCKLAPQQMPTEN